MAGVWGLVGAGVSGRREGGEILANGGGLLERAVEARVLVEEQDERREDEGQLGLARGEEPPPAAAAGRARGEGSAPWLRLGHVLGRQHRCLCREGALAM